MRRGGCCDQFSSYVRSEHLGASQRKALSATGKGERSEGEAETRVRSESPDKTLAGNDT